MTAAYICIDDLFDTLFPMLPGATAPAVKSTAEAVLREFLGDSASWRVRTDPFTLKAGKEDYYLSPPAANSQVLHAHALFFNNEGTWKPIPVVNERVLRSTPLAVSSMPMYFCGNATEPGKITVRPVVGSDVPGALQAEVSLTINSPWNGQIPGFIGHFWREVLVDGIAGRMMMQQDKPYTNLGNAQYHLRRFRAGIARARDAARRQNTEANSIVQFPRWA